MSIVRINEHRNYDDGFVVRIKENFLRFSNNKQLAIFLGIKLSTLRSLCYQLGLKRMELEYFTTQQIKYLINNYKRKGDIELAEIFQKSWPKQKGWTKKHIEKKRKYLNLERTSEEIRAIHSRNVKAGRFRMCPVKAWDKRGRAKVGEIRYWTNNNGIKYPVIKCKDRFVHWGRWTWENYHGKISHNLNVVFKDGNQYNLLLENLEIISNAELARRNSKKSSKGLSDNYVAGVLSNNDPLLRNILKKNKNLIDIKRKQLILNRTIYESQKNFNHT